MTGAHCLFVKGPMPEVGREGIGKVGTESIWIEMKRLIKERWDHVCFGGGSVKANLSVKL